MYLTPHNVMQSIRKALSNLGSPKYKQMELELSPSEDIVSRTKNLIAATNLGKKETQAVRDFIAEHGIARLLGTAALGTGTATGLVIGGHRLLSPQEEAQLTITPEGELIAAEPDENDPVLPAGLALVGTAGLLANQYSLDQEQEREMEIIRQQVEGDAYIDELRREASQDATRFTDTVLSKETQGELNDLIKGQRRTRTRPSARR